jgi:hypothetical protein
VTNLVGPTAGHCGLPTRQGINLDQLPRTEREKYHARRGKRTSTTHRKKEPSATLGSREGGSGLSVCTKGLRVRLLLSKGILSHFSDGTMGFSRGRRYTGPSARGRRGTTPQPPRWRNSVPRRNEPSRTDCGALRPLYAARHRAGSTSTHRARNVPRTAREANKYYAPKEVSVRESCPAAQQTKSVRLRCSAASLYVKALGRVNYHVPT